MNYSKYNFTINPKIEEVMNSFSEKWRKESMFRFCNLMINLIETDKNILNFSTTSLCVKIKKHELDIIAHFFKMNCLDNLHKFLNYENSWTIKEVLMFLLSQETDSEIRLKIIDVLEQGN